MTRAQARRWGTLAVVAGGLGWAAALLVDPRQAWLAYLMAVMATLTVALGAVSLVLMAHLSDAVWFVVMRRIAEAVAGSTWLMVVLLVPLVFGLRDLYPWLTPDRLEPHVREMVVRKSAYLNEPFFLIRALVYVASWLLIVARLRRWSTRQDAGEPAASLRGFSAAAAIVFGLTLTFASFDWLMSLRPDWFSTIYGLRVFAGTVPAALGLMAVLVRTGRLPVKPDHAQALASLLLSFVIFWFYIAFAQLLIVWIGNEPAEITWYVARSHGVWLATGVVLGVGNFAVPFLLLLFRRIKRSPVAMARLGVWLLAMHALDLCWLAGPDANGLPLALVWMYPAALLLTGGAAAVMAAWWLGDRPPLPVRDPELPESLEYEFEEG
ncbi:MAG TPA: hypothetical protein VG871_21310 [Vicinamibacterales bacterium]|nr:hypothetical protein [Vicinamibacterales bacterium]